MITEVKKLQETREEIHKVLADLNTSEKKYLKAMAFNFVDYLEQVQRMPLVLRLALYHVVFCLFDLLLRNRQLGRREGAFDTETREAIRSVLSENLEDYYDE